MPARVRTLLSSALATLLAAGPLVVLAPPASAAVPTGFRSVERPTGQGQFLLTSFDVVLPSGALFTAGKDGRVTWVSPDDSVVRTVAQLPTRNVGDIGLVGIEVAPDYPTTGRVYTVRAVDDARSTDGAGFHRLTEHVVDDPTSPTRFVSERVVLDGITTGTDVHGATGIVAAADGTLWLSVGDAADFNRADPLSMRSLDVNDPHGKLLHVNRDGSGVASNPFYDPAAPRSWRSRVHASGFRSPFRFSLDPRSGAPILADVGWLSEEEVNVVRPGASYSWPCWEGNQRTPGHEGTPGCAVVPNTPPLISHVRPDFASITGGFVYTGTEYPEQYRGVYFYGDYVTRRLSVARIGSDGRLAAPPTTFGTEVGNPVDFEAGPGGDVMYADIGTSKVVRVAYSASNQPPVPKVTTSTDAATRTVTFDASASTDPDGDALRYRWEFGDGAVGSGVRVSHVYPATPERFTARLVVTDSIGNSSTSSVVVVPGNHAPSVSLTPPSGTSGDGTFAVGDTVSLSASASDVEDGPLEVSWSVDRLHCETPELCHSHPGETGTGGSFSVVFDDHGGSTSLVVRARATDSTGVTSEREFTARPALRRLRVVTSHPAPVTLNGRTASDVEVVVGSTNSVSVPASASGATFTRWEDGSTAPARTLVMPDGPVVLTATYTSAISARYDSDPAARALLGAPLSPEEGDSSVRWRVYQRGRMYWSAPGGTRVVYGAILDRYLAAGGHAVLGPPTTDERPGLSPGVRVTSFTGAEVYWTPAMGPKLLLGSIRRTWQRLGGEGGPLGYPVTDELTTPDGVGRYNHFSKAASVYWTPQTDAHAVWGAIRARWEALGWELGPMGYPTNSETRTPDRPGAFNHFSKGGSIYWSPSTGAHGVWGSIRTRWAALGWENGYLGFPTSDEFRVPGGARSNFQGGYVTWSSRTGAVSDRRY